MLRLCDMTLRDGLQSFPKIISTAKKLNIYKRIANSGINAIEFGSNVSPKITQMADFQNLLKGISMYHSQNKLLYKPELIALVPSKKKYKELSDFHSNNIIETVSLITAATDAFSFKNTGMTIQRTMTELDEIIDTKKHKYRIYISCCFGCPFTDDKAVIIQNTVKIINRYIYHPFVSEIIISDTIGKYDEHILNAIMDEVFEHMHVKLGLHLHINRDDIFKVLVSSLASKIKTFDVSFGNTGGCPTLDKKDMKMNIDIVDFLTLTRKIGFKDTLDLDVVHDNAMYINHLLKNSN